MKKYITFVILAFACLFANAQPSNISSLEQAAYFKNTTIQIGTTGNIELMLKYPSDKWNIGSIQYKFTLPEGVTLKEVKAKDYTPPVTASDYSVLGGLKGTFNVATLVVEVDKNVAPGEYDMVITDYMMADDNDPTRDIVGENIVSTLTISKTAVIEPQSDDVQFDILPEIVSAGAVDLKVLLKNKLDVANFTLTVTYPEGVTPKSGRGSAPTVIKDNLYSSTDASVTALSIANTVNGQVATYTVSNAALDTYMAKNEYYTAFTLPVTISGADALYNITAEISDIVAYDAANDANLVNPISIPGGGFATSLFLGTPTETAPTLYGHYTSDIVSTLNGGVAKNFCTIDMSAATVDEGCKVNDALVYTADKTTYDRSITTTYGTVCLPIEATGTFYTLSAATADKLTFTPLEGKLPANTPAIFSGAISAAAEGTVTPGTPGTGATANGLTLTGTYKTFELAVGAGYFISKDKFYNDGATVKAFRSYFTGTISSGAKALRIEIEDANGVRDITDQLSDQDIFNLQGIRVQTAKKGVNIINGKKVYVK